MKRWQMAWLGAVISALYVFLHRSKNPSLLRDSDTFVTIAKIRERQNPWSWFWGDWPLENHFYRPISTLAYEFDNAVFRDWAAGYATTNAFLCALCVLLTFWFVRELTDRPILSVVTAATFALWHTFRFFEISVVLQTAWFLTLLVGLLRHGFRGRNYVPAILLLMAAYGVLNSAAPIGSRTLEWIPGRTAIVMTVFCLLALAAYARYERLAGRPKPEQGPFDPPATRNTEIGAGTPRSSLWLGVVAVACTALALGSYEQAVMLPACLLGVAVVMRWMGYRVRWAWQAPFWALLVGYLVLRKVLLPAEISGYQDQQLRFGPGVLFALNDYFLPSLRGLVMLPTLLESGWVILLSNEPVSILLATARDVGAVIYARARLPLTAFAWAMGLVSFLPMAFLQQFDHYHYWPLTFRALLFAMLGWLALERLVIAWSPPGGQAPPRPHLAPGSLPRQ